MVGVLLDGRLIAEVGRYVEGEGCRESRRGDLRSRLEGVVELGCFGV